MKLRKFYIEYDEVEKTWDIVEEGGGQEHGQWYDVLMFCCTTEQDADDAINLLNELQQGST
jgi:hypothetical protein